MSDGIPLSALARVPWLVIRLVFSALRFKRKAIKSARKVRKGLIKGGMNRAKATELTAKYEEMFSIRKLLTGATGGNGISSILPFGR
ncbi:MAG: hypothetical protein R6W91_05330 [Thermoplasmata archaeon]